MCAEQNRQVAFSPFSLPPPISFLPTPPPTDRPTKRPPTQGGTRPHLASSPFPTVPTKSPSLFSSSFARCPVERMEKVAEAAEEEDREGGGLWTASENGLRRSPVLLEPKTIRFLLCRRRRRAFLLLRWEHYIPSPF